MAKAKAKTPAKAATVRPTAAAPVPPQDRLGSVRLERAIGRAIASAVAGLGDRKMLTSAARELLSGTLTPQAALLSIAQAGSEAVAAAAKQAQHAAAQQALTSRQLRDDLLRVQTGSAAPRPRKDDYVLRGNVLLASGEPAVGLAVEAIDKDVVLHDVLGAAITDTSGAFQILFRKKAFHESGEKDPEVVISVGMEGEAALHVTRPTRLFESDRQANVTVSLAKDTDARARRPAANRDVHTTSRLLRIAHAQALSDLQQRQFDEIVKEAQAGLGKLIAALQRPVGKVSDGGTAPRQRTK